MLYVVKLDLSFGLLVCEAHKKEVALRIKMTLCLTFLPMTPRPFLFKGF